MFWLIAVVAVMALVAFWPSAGNAAGFFRRGGAVRGTKRCQRCYRNVNGLRPYVDGRSEFWVCDMCYAELEIAHSANPPLPRV
jgi:hypothetical protein